MNLFDLFEGVIDELEARRIEDLEAKMDDLTARAKAETDPKYKEALRHEYAKAKAERDSYYKINVDEAPGAETLAHNQSTDASNLEALGLDEHGGGGGGPREWHNYVKAHRTNEEEVDEHGGGVNGMKNYIAWRKNANKERGITKAPPPVGKPASSKLPSIPKGSVHSKLDQSRGVVPNASFEDAIKVAPLSQPRYGVYVNGQIHLTFETPEEAKTWAKSKKEHNPTSDIEIKKVVINPGGHTPRSISVVDEATGLGSQVKIVKGSYAGQTGTVGELRTGAFKGAPKTYTVDLADGTSVQLPKEALRLVKDMGEESMASAAHNPDGPKFGGYWKGTDKAPPKPGQGFGGCEESEEKENPLGDKELAYLIAKAKGTHSKPDPELHKGDEHEINGDQDNVGEGIEGNMRVRSTPLDLRKPKVVSPKLPGGKHSNALKKARAKGVTENFAQWAMENGYNNFTSNPAIYESARKAFTEIKKGQKDSNGVSSCWSGYHADGTKPGKNGPVRNCVKNESIKEDQHLSVDQLATISDKALDDAYHYGRSQPGNTFGWQANLKSAAFAKQMIDKGVTDIEQISDAIHKGWNVTAQAFVKNPMMFDDAKTMAPEKLQAKIAQRQKLMTQNYAQLPEEEKEKDRVVARAMLQAITGQQEVNETEAWQKANRKDKTSGMSKKAVKSYRREHPGSKLQTAVTTKPSKLKKGSKAAKRRKSFCARMSGNKGPMKKPNGKPTPKALALRRWHCESIENLDAMLRETTESGGNLQPGQYYVWEVFFDDGTSKRIKVTKDNFDPKAYYAKQNKNVINVEYNWDVHNG